MANRNNIGPPQRLTPEGGVKRILRGVGIGRGEDEATGPIAAQEDAEKEMGEAPPRRRAASRRSDPPEGPAADTGHDHDADDDFGDDVETAGSRQSGESESDWESEYDFSGASNERPAETPDDGGLDTITETASEPQSNPNINPQTGNPYIDPASGGGLYEMPTFEDHPMQGVDLGGRPGETWQQSWQAQGYDPSDPTGGTLTGRHTFISDTQALDREDGKRYQFDRETGKWGEIEGPFRAAPGTVWGDRTPAEIRAHLARGDAEFGAAPPTPTADVLGDLPGPPKPPTHHEAFARYEAAQAAATTVAPTDPAPVVETPTVSGPTPTSTTPDTTAPVVLPPGDETFDYLIASGNQRLRAVDKSNGLVWELQPGGEWREITGRRDYANAQEAALLADYQRRLKQWDNVDDEPEAETPFDKVAYEKELQRLKDEAARQNPVDHRTDGVVESVVPNYPQRDDLESAASDREADLRLVAADERARQNPVDHRKGGVVGTEPPPAAPSDGRLWAPKIVWNAAKAAYVWSAEPIIDATVRYNPDQFDPQGVGSVGLVYKPGEGVNIKDFAYDTTPITRGEAIALGLTIAGGVGWGFVPKGVTPTGRTRDGVYVWPKVKPEGFQHTAKGSGPTAWVDDSGYTASMRGLVDDVPPLPPGGGGTAVLTKPTTQLAGQSFDDVAAVLDKIAASEIKNLGRPGYAASVSERFRPYTGQVLTVGGTEYVVSPAGVLLPTYTAAAQKVLTATTAASGGATVPGDAPDLFGSEREAYGDAPTPAADSPSTSTSTQPETATATSTATATQQGIAAAEGPAPVVTTPPAVGTPPAIVTPPVVDTPPPAIVTPPAIDTPPAVTPKTTAPGAPGQAPTRIPTDTTTAAAAAAPIVTPAADPAVVADTPPAEVPATDPAVETTTTPAETPETPTAPPLGGIAAPIPPPVPRGDPRFTRRLPPPLPHIDREAEPIAAAPRRPGTFPRRVAHVEDVEYGYDPATDSYTASVVDVGEPVVTAWDQTPPQEVARQVEAWTITPRKRGIIAEEHGDVREIPVPPGVKAQLISEAAAEGGPVTSRRQVRVDHDLDSGDTTSALRRTLAAIHSAQQAAADAAKRKADKGIRRKASRKRKDDLKQSPAVLPGVSITMRRS